MKHAKILAAVAVMLTAAGFLSQAQARDTDPMDVMLGTDPEPHDFEKHPDADYTYITAAKSAPVVPGWFHGDVSTCLAYAKKNGLPMMAMWSNTGCSHCKVTEWGLLNTNFVNWAKDSGIVYCFSCPRNGQAVGGYDYNWCWGPKKKTGVYPFVRFYWEKDGEVLVDQTTYGEVVIASHGVDNNDKKSHNRAGFAAAEYVSNVFAKAGWTFSSYNGGMFGDNSGVKIYAGKTTSIDLELVREGDAAKVAATNIVIASGLSPTESVTNSVEWLATCTRTNATVTIKTSGADKDKVLNVLLTDEAGETKDEINIPVESVYMGGVFESPVVTSYYGKATSMTVKLVRENFTDWESSNTVIVDYPDGYGVADCTTNVTWGVGDTEKVIEINLDKTWTPAAGNTGTITTQSVSGTSAGGEIAVKLLDEFGEDAGAMTVALEKAPYLGGTLAESYAGGSFKIEKGAGDTLYVRLSRSGEAAKYDYTNNTVRVVVTSGETVTTNDVEVTFKAGDAMQAVPLEIGELAPGATVSVQVVCTEEGYGEDSGEAATYTVIEPLETTAGNPLWIGEKDETSLQPGEWTMDLDVAKAAASANDGKVFVYVGGPLWCPYCQNSEESLLGTDAFKAWATSNKIYCVTIDEPSTTGATNSPSLLTDVKYTGTSANVKTLSGVEYMSRKMISPDEAAKTFERNVAISKNWRLPGATAWRVSNPTFFILDGDGKIRGRFNSYRTAQKVYDPEENIPRLDDLLTLCGEDGEELNQTAQTTTNELATGESFTTTLHINDTVDVFKMTDTAAASRVFAATSASGRAVRLTMTWYAGEADFTVVKTARSDTGTLTIEDESLENAYLSVSAFHDVGKTSKVGGEMSTDVAVDSRVVVIPRLEEAAHEGAAGTKLDIKLEIGKTYRIASEPPGKDYEILDGLVPADGFKDTFFCATSGIAEISFNSNTTLKYRLWEPGTIGFTAAEFSVLEGDPSGKGKITVARTPAASAGDMATGIAKMLVKFDAEAFADVEEGVAVNGVRFEWPEAGIPVEWADGETGEKEVEFALKPNADSEGREYFAVVIEDNGGDYADIDPDAQNAVVSIFDTTSPCFGDTEMAVSLYKGVANTCEFELFNVEEAASITLVKKSGALPAGMKFTGDPATGTAVLSGTPTKLGTFTATYAVQAKRGRISEVTEKEYYAEFTFKVFDPTVSNTDLDGMDTVPCPYAGKAVAFLPAPVAREVPGGTVCAGLLEVSATAAGKISAKFDTTVSARQTLSGNWSGYDPATGEMSATLAKRNVYDSVSKKRYDITLDLTMKPDGSLSATITNGLVDDGAPMTVSTAANPWSKSNTAEDYVGSYTVTLPAMEESAVAEDEAGVAPVGTGWLTLKMAASAAKTGKFNYGGTLPNGVSVRGSAVLIPSGDGESALLPIFKRTASDTVAIVLEVYPGGEGIKPVNVSECAEFTSWWGHTKGVSYVVPVEAYGGWWDTVTPLEVCCENFNYATNVVFTFAAEPDAIETGSKGRLVGIGGCDHIAIKNNRFVVTGADKGFTIGYNKTTGVITGKVPLKFELTTTSSSCKTTTRTSTVSATMTGVVLPGWIDCGCEPVPPPERPFGSGSLIFSDKVDGKSMTRGFYFEIDAAVVGE